MLRCPSCGSFYPTERICPRDGSTLEEADAVVDRYLVVDRIGEGGMGAVYKASHTLLDNRVVAIKMLHRQLSQNPEVVNRFFREARAASQIENEHIVEVIDFGVTHQGDSFLVMEFIDGENLREVVDLQAPLELERAFTIGVQIAEGLYAAHRKGIVHRDLKPENVLLIHRDGQEFVKLLDFGIAKLTETKDSRLTRAGMVVGTPAYMSPEQAGAEPVDHRTDIYALGTILYEMLTGQVPFVGESTKEVLLSQLTRAPVPPRQLREEIPRSVEKVILKALHKERDERPQTMIHLAYGLRDALAKRTQESSGALLAVDPDGEQLEAAARDELVIASTSVPDLGPDPTLEVQLPPSPIRRYLPFIGLGGGLVLGILVTVLLMSGGGDPPKVEIKTRTKVVKQVVVIHAEAGPTLAPAPAPIRHDAAPAARRHKRVAHHRPVHRTGHRRVKKPQPLVKPKFMAEPTGTWVATVTSQPAGAEVYSRGKKLGMTPMKVPTAKLVVLDVHRIGYESAKLVLPKHATKTFTARLRKSNMSWEVLSLSQLKQMMVKGQISRFTYNRRKAQLIKKRDQKITRLRVKHKMGHITKEQYERSVEAVKANYK